MKKHLLLIVMMAIAIGAQAQTKFVGGDISMLKKFVDEGAIYKDKDGNAVEPLVFFKEQGWNAMRVRLFVDPTKATADEKKEGVIQDLEYVKELGKSIKDAGFKFMLDFHYSDTWTDPGNHKTPAAWSSMTVEELTTQINTYTETCLTALKKEGAEPDFIQTGNEITTGMLWNTGKVNSDGTDTSTGSMKNLAGYLASAIKACKKVCPDAKIVIHTELHAASSLPQFYQKLSAYTDVAYDIIGLSYYPDYHGTITNLGNLLTTLETNHADKQIMIVETGYGFEWALPDVKDAYKNQYPVSEDGQRQFAVALNTELKKHSKVNGLFWWYPEYTLNNIVFKDGSEDWDKNFTSGYWNAALFHYKTGKALAALYELKNFASGSDGIQNIKAEKATDDAWYSLDGQRMATKPATKGIFIHQGRKVINR